MLQHQEDEWSHTSNSEATRSIWDPEQEIGVNKKEYSASKFLIWDWYGEKAKRISAHKDSKTLKQIEYIFQRKSFTKLA